ncbi:amidohydrolase family protein [Nocardia sp. NPDC002869]|uniref:amidohydrolase family protein n=1 Tax=Nocardia sp. NPDC002869 TaxID=3161032 RepID=UPI00398C9CAD
MPRRRCPRRSETGWRQDVLDETVAALDAADFRIYVHAIGNPGFYPEDNVLDAFEYAAQRNARRDSRHAITHLDWTRREDLARFRELGRRRGAIASQQRHGLAGMP